MSINRRSKSAGFFFLIGQTHSTSVLELEERDVCERLVQYRCASGKLPFRRIGALGDNLERIRRMIPPDPICDWSKAPPSPLQCERSFPNAAGVTKKVKTLSSSSEVFPPVFPLLHSPAPFDPPLTRGRTIQRCFPPCRVPKLSRPRPLLDPTPPDPIHLISSRVSCSLMSFGKNFLAVERE